MTDLIACLSTGKGTWGHVSRLMQAEEWGKVFLVTNSFGKERFTSERPFEFVVVDDTQLMEQMVASLKQQLDGKFTDFEVAVNIFSGSGKEHMALLSAVQQLGFGYRLVFLGEDGKVVEL